MVKASFQFEQGMLTSNLDVSGFTKMLNQEKKQRFYALNNQGVYIYPDTSNEYKKDVAIEIELKLSKIATNIDQEVYSLTHWLVDIGGISRATYVIGGLMAHFFAI